MPKKKTAPTAASARRQETVAINAVERASQAITILRNQLPDPDAAAKLSHLFVQLAGILSSQLEGRAKSAMPAADVDVVRAMVQLATSLLDYLHANLEEMVPLLAYIEDWPAVASINPVRDARRVVKYPESAAAKLYKPVTEHLGTRRFFPPVVSKKRGIFHEIAEESAYTVYFQGLLDDRWRERGLPGFFDFIDNKGALQKPRLVRPQGQDEASVDALFQHYADLARERNEFLNIPVVLGPKPEPDKTQMDARRRAELRSSLIALKYHIELVSAPEPRRTLLRNNWRALRVARFAALKFEGEFEKELHRRFMEQAPRAATDPRQESGRNLSARSSLWTDFPSVTPSWVRWWTQCLAGEPAAYFGNRAPLTEWDDLPIRKLMEAKHVGESPISGFGRCITEILAVYLRLCGSEYGIEEFQGPKKSLPKAPDNPPVID